jgi:Icc-related predicted phosphoesterase
MNLLIFISDTMGLFKRRSPEVVQKRDTTRILFTSDIHGSEVVFRKLLNAGKIYKVDAIVIGGDVAGKRLVPCVEVEPGKFRVAGKTVGREGLKLVLDEIKASGDYYVEVNEKDYKAMMRTTN